MNEAAATLDVAASWRTSPLKTGVPKLIKDMKDLAKQLKTKVKEYSLSTVALALFLGLLLATQHFLMKGVDAGARGFRKEGESGSRPVDEVGMKLIAECVKDCVKDGRYELVLNKIRARILEIGVFGPADDFVVFAMGEPGLSAVRTELIRIRSELSDMLAQKKASTPESTQPEKNVLPANFASRVHARE